MKPKQSIAPLFSFITDKPLWANVLAGLGLFFIICLIIYLSLSSFTNHNQTQSVPSVLGLSIEDVQKKLRPLDIGFIVQDSLYVDSVNKGVVVKQLPNAGSIVKTNRSLFITINRWVPPFITLPNIKGYTLENAKTAITNLGLKLGNVIYKPDIANNAVLQVRSKGLVCQPNTPIQVGNSIDLVVGNGISPVTIDVPNVVGLSFEDAKNQLDELQINYNPILDEDVKTINEAFVYKQNPPAIAITGGFQNQINRIKPGDMVDLWLTKNPPVIDSLKK